VNRKLSSSSLDTLETRFGMAVAARLSENAQDLPSDLGERLRFAREQALERGRALRRAEAVTAPQQAGVTAGGALMLGGGPRWWFRLVAALPALALVAGLVVIQMGQSSADIAEAAEVDAALLSDDLPPNAYSDAGFVEFLKTPPHE
jgi:hypothetical protein